MASFVTERDEGLFHELIEDLHNGGILHFMGEDHRNLVAWAHSHASICQHMPCQGEGYVAEESTTFVLPWSCTAGHAYNWPLSSLSERVGEIKENMSRKRRKRGICKEEDEEQGAEERPTSLRITREEGPAESDDSLVTHLSGEHREAPVPQQAKRKRQKKKVQATSTSDPQEEEAPFPSTSTGRSGGSWGASLPKITKLSESLTLERDRMEDEDNVSPGGAMDETQPSMHLEDLCCGMDTDSAAEDEPMSSSQSGAGDAVPTGLSWGQSQSQRLKAEGRPSSLEPRQSPHMGSSTSTATSSTTDNRSSKSTAAVKKKAKGSMGGLSNVLTFQPWLRLTNTNEVAVGSLALAELDALLMSYLKYMWDGAKHQLTHVTLLCQARVLDRILRAQGCFYSVTRSPELPQTRRLMDQYYKQLYERETERYSAVVCGMTQSEEEELRRLGVLGRSSPEALLHLVLYNNLRAFGPAHLYRMWPVPAGQFRPLRQKPGSPLAVGPGVKGVPDCLEWTDLSNPGQAPRRMLARHDEPLRCPLRDFCIYVTKHTAAHLNDHDALYSTVRSGVHLHSAEWYSRTPLSRTRLDKMLMALAQRVEAIRITRMAAPV